jgi:hypothetical protein
MKKKIDTPSISVKKLSASDASVAYSKLQLPQGFPSFPFLHGFLVGITTTPSMIAPSDWQEVLFGDLIFDSEAQLQPIWNMLMPMTNGLLTEIHLGTLCIPTCVVQPAMADQSWNNLVEWSQGFSLANSEFRHLWDITLEDIAEKLDDRALATEFWDTISLTWTALISACKADIMEVFRQSEPFNGLPESELRPMLLTEYQANIKYLAKTCEKFMLIKQELRERG